MPEIERMEGRLCIWPGKSGMCVRKSEGSYIGEPRREDDDGGGGCNIDDQCAHGALIQ